MQHSRHWSLATCHPWAGRCRGKWGLHRRRRWARWRRPGCPCANRCRDKRSRVHGAFPARRRKTAAVRFANTVQKPRRQSGPSCHSKPNQRRSSIICGTNSSLKRVESMSSLRNTSVPLFARARSCATQKVRAWPRCNNPVGDGARRPRYCGLWIADCGFTEGN